MGVAIRGALRALGALGARESERVGAWSQRAPASREGRHVSRRVSVAEWVRRELRFLVAAGRGAWGADAHPVLGRRLYVFESPDISFQICERGLHYRSSSEAADIHFVDIKSIRVSDLKAVMAGKRTMGPLAFWVEVGDSVRGITLPIVVYSSVSTTVARIISDMLFES